MIQMPERTLRLSGLARSTLIGYGVAVFTWLFSRQMPADADHASSGSAGGMLAAGLGVQLVLFLIQRWAAHYDRNHGPDDAISPVVMYSCEILLDGVTVLLFAIATFSGIAQFTSDI